MNGMSNSYAQAGVDTHAGDRAVELMKAAVSEYARPPGRRRLRRVRRPVRRVGPGKQSIAPSAGDTNRWPRQRRSPSPRRSTSTTHRARPGGHGRRRHHRRGSHAAVHDRLHRVREVLFPSGSPTRGRASLERAPRREPHSSAARRPSIRSPRARRLRRRGRGGGRRRGVGCSAPSSCGRRRRARPRVVGPALQRVLAGAPHPASAGIGYADTTADLGGTRRGAPRAHAPLHVAPAARARRGLGRGGRAFAAPRHRRWHRGESRPGASARLLGRGRSRHVVAADRCSACLGLAGSTLESRRRNLEPGIGMFAIVDARAGGCSRGPPRCRRHPHMAGRAPSRSGARTTGFEQGAKGVDGGAVRLVGAFAG